MDGKPLTSARRRVRSLSRGRPIEPALFTPIAHSVAAQIEGWDEREFVLDPTKMSRGLEALHKAIATDGIFTSTASGMEAEAAGAELDWSTYPPQVLSPPLDDWSEAGGLPEELVSSARIGAALETTRRLAATVTDGPLLAAVVTGPRTLANQLVGSTAEISDQGWEICGRICAELARLFCEAGSHMIVVQEETIPTDDRAGGKWLEAPTPLINIVRFHKKLVVKTAADNGNGGVWAQGDGFAATGLPGDPSQWRNSPVSGSLTITVSEIPANTDLPKLSEKCQEIVTRLTPS